MAFSISFLIWTHCIPSNSFTAGENGIPRIAGYEDVHYEEHKSLSV